MNNLTQKSLNAYEAGSNASMSETYNVFVVILIGLLFMLIAYVVVCILDGLGDRGGISFNDIPSYVIRTIILILAVIAFFLYNK